MKQEVRKILQAENYQPTDRQISQLEQFYQLLSEKNKVMNLTALAEPQDFLEKHLRDSLLLHRHFQFESETRLIDVGTGAGFPGIPIAVMEPELTVVLLDSLTKRIHFLEEVIAALDLKNAKVLNSRAESAGRQPQLRESFDYCVSRAVSHLNKLSEYCLPLVRPGGYFIPYKAEKVLAELLESERAISLLGGELTAIKEDRILDARRFFPLIRKRKKTPPEYPRNSEKIAKKPL